MLGYIRSGGQGETDRLLKQVADRLQAQGLHLAGAVQTNLEQDASLKCHMDLHILPGTNVVRISQSLGSLSKGCRLDADGLERAVGLVQAGMANGADLLIVNKFGKQEAEGRGFRPVIGAALGQDIPVLTAVNDSNIDAFHTFAEDLAQPLPLDADAVLEWCLAQH